jgi:cold shock CspA family protein
MTEVQARHLRETDKISSSHQMIEHSSQECRRLRGEVGTTIAAISLLRDRAQDAERTIRRYERDIDDDALKYVGGILSSLERDSERLVEEEERVTTFDNIQLDRFRKLRHEAEIAVGNLKLPDDYWWNEEIERGPDLQRRARECDAHAQRVVAAIEEARGDWEGRLSQAQEYLTGRDGHNELLLRFRESTDRAREIFDENDDRLFGTVRGLFSDRDFGFIMQRVGEDVFFNANDVIGDMVSGGDRVRYAVDRARARNRAVRVQRIPPWVPPWRN